MNAPGFLTNADNVTPPNRIGATKMKPRVAITDFISETSIEQPVLEGLAELVCLDVTGSEELLARVGEFDLLICYHKVSVTAEVLERASRCRAIIRGGVGYDNIDICHAGKLGIVVCNVPDYGTEEVADHTIGLLLAAVRNIVEGVEAVRAGRWPCPCCPQAPRLRGRTLGIIGCGRIGSAVALRAKPFGLRVLFYDPYVPPGYEKALGVQRADSLETLLPQCHFLTVHCSLTDETRHMLDAKAFSLLPAGCYLVNTARGGIVDEQALLDALDSGRLAAAAVDVLEHEPPEDERLRSHPRLLITPHSAFYSTEAGPELRRKTAEEAKRILLGHPPLNAVNRPWLQNPRACV